MGKIKIGLLQFLVIMAVFAVISITFTLAYFLTGWLFHLTGWKIPDLAVQIINFIFSLILDVAVIRGIVLATGKRRQLAIYESVLAVLERISKGDFRARVGKNTGVQGVAFGVLTNGINNMAEELDRMEAMRQEFISSVSHEIQSPLTSIRGFARLLDSDHLASDEKQRYLGIIESEIQRLSRLTENLLRLAALDAQTARINPENYRLDIQIREIVQTAEPQWTEKNIELDIRLDELSLTADRDMLGQVWTNLLHNAVKFIPTGGKIRMELHKEPDSAFFTIVDNGIGISEEDQGRVFDRFYKADISRTAAVKGSGLGLSIVKKIVEMHGGSVGLKSRPGEGSEFTVRLPFGYSGQAFSS